MAEAAKKTQLELIENSLRTCLQGIKTVYNLVEQKAKVPDVVQACKTLVANVSSLVSQTKPLEFEKLSKSGEEFKAAVSNIIKAGRSFG